MKKLKNRSFLVIFLRKNELWIWHFDWQTAGKWFLKNVPFFNEKSTIFWSKSDFLVDFRFFPGGYPGFGENTKFRLANSGRKWAKLPKVYAISGFWGSFWSFWSFWGHFDHFEVILIKFSIVTVRKSLTKCHNPAPTTSLCLNMLFLIIVVTV